MNIWTPEKVDELVALAQKGLSAVQIAIALHVTRNAVMGKCMREGVKLAGAQPVSPRTAVFGKLDQHRTEIVERLDKAHSKARMLQVLSAKFGVSMATVRAWMRDRGMLPSHDPAHKPKTVRKLYTFTPPPVEGIPFLDAGPDNCRYPLWGIEERIGNVCGRQVAEKVVKDEVRRLSWCPECLTRVASGRVAEAA